MCSALLARLRPFDRISHIFYVKGTPSASGSHLFGVCLSAGGVQDFWILLGDGMFVFNECGFCVRTWVLDFLSTCRADTAMLARFALSLSLGSGARVFVAECDPFGALQACLEDIQVVAIDSVVSEIDTFLLLNG